MRLNATTVKSYFQYRCERQLRYLLMTPNERGAIPLLERAEEDAPWREFGIEYEAGVHAVLQPPAGEKLTASQSIAFVQGKLPIDFAHQLRLETPADGAFRARRMRCFANLTLVSDEASPRQWYARRLRFHVPHASRDAEIQPGAFAVILHDDDPDLRLDPSAWVELFVDLQDIEESDRGMFVVVDIPQDTFDAPLYGRLRERAGDNDYFLDLAHRDFNTPRLTSFLQFLSNG